MKGKELQSLVEAYENVYAQQNSETIVEVLEEVEIATHYFIEMGLNEDGVDILIEDLGVEEFVNFVYDIAEEYVLTEARAGGVKIEPKLASGKEIKGKPKAASLKRLRAQKDARKETEAKTSASKPSGMKASLQRQSAVAAAAKKQPKKPGLLDRVAGAVNRGIERHKKAMGELDKMKTATSVTVGKVKKAAGEFKRGFTSEEVELAERMRGDEGAEDDPRNPEVIRHNLSLGYTASGRSRPKPQQKSPASARDSLKLKGKVPKKGGKDMFEHILEYLVAEGYADTNKAALAIMANMSEEWREDIVEAYKDLPVGKMIRQAGRKQFRHGMKVGYGDSSNPQVSQQIGKISAHATLHDPQAAQAKSKFKKD